MASLNLNLDSAKSNTEVVQLVELGNGVVQITMKDEENRNTFSPGIIEGLCKCFGAVAQNKSYKVVILTGYGNYFSSGATKEHLIRLHKKEIKLNDSEVLRLVLDCKIPVISAMQGHGIGGGFLLGLYADFVVLSQESIYTTNFMKYGFTPVGATSLILPNKLGIELGQEMMYTARNYRGKELAKRGISVTVVPKKDVLNHAKKLANEIAEKPRLSLITLKQHLTSEFRNKLPEVMKKELIMYEKTFHQPEVASRIETIYSEANISKKPDQLNQDWINKSVKNHNQLSPLSVQKNNQSTMRTEVVKNSPNLPKLEPFKLKLSRYGSLKNLTLAPLQRRIPGPGEVEVQMKAVAINFREVLDSLGMFQEYNEKILGITCAEELTFGAEGSGIVVAVGPEVSQWQVGDEVIVGRTRDAFSSFFICSLDKLIAKPSNLNMLEAVTLPVSFSTAYYGLHYLTKIQPGERVLIHAASGGAGQAAVKVAQFFGAEIFATTSPNKMAFLREQGIKHVMNSRTTEFADEIMEITQGRGVDVIFNSLTHGEYIQKNIDILAEGGRYLEIGKLNIWTHEQVAQKRPDVKYFPFDLSEECARDNQLHYQIWDNLLKHFECGHLKPLPYKTFPIEDVVEAFRYMQHTKHIGKVVVTMPQVYDRQEVDSSQLPLQEEVLHQLQSGEISLDNAEKLLLGISGEKVQEKVVEKNQIYHDQNKPINPDNSEEILSLISTREISLENAEELLLEVVESKAKTEINGLNSVLNQEQISRQEEVLHHLQSGEVSLDNADKLLLVKTGEEVQEKAIDKNKIYNNNIQNTDIAIVGMSCRYPGAKNWKEFWENLKNGVDSVTEVPPGRWEEKNWYHPDPEHPGTSYSKSAGFLDEIDKFDPLFFQISPGEAQFIEPQQRIFLEEAYHAIEDAGYAADSLKGKQCGVFVGALTNGDYSKLLSNSGLGTHRLAGTGNMVSMVPARIAYFLDLKGPVMAVDTACSSSLVAVHQACESIRRGESEMAIAGGIATMATVDFQILSSQFQTLSTTGRCNTFDASASGTVWGEGCGVVLLKSYDQAIRDNDHIYGVIKGTGINYDGNTNGISAPSCQSQTRLEEAVYQKFGINPETISYVEAHGTATPLGDPIEVEALTETFSKWTNKKQFCAIGSVKTNIGHPTTAAGVAGLIKTILCLKNQKLVPSLHFNQSNPHIDFENSPFYVNTEFKDWELPDGKPRRATVSSFGFSGTNAHIVLEEAPTQVKSQKSKVKSEDFCERSCHILTLSAKCEKALQQLGQRYHELLGDNSTAAIADVCFSANTGRSHFDHRLALVAESREKLIQQLKAFETGEQTTGLLTGQLTSQKQPKIAFLFTGQGSQYVDMGRELYETQPVFRKTLEQCNAILSLYLEKPLLSILYPEPGENSAIDETAYTQPALFAIEYALAQLWQSWGIKPDVVMGHSVGEYVAATIAGVFSLEDGLELIAHRGRLMQQLPPGGEMVAVMASSEKVNQLIAPYKEKVAIAAINGPKSIVISGAAEAVGTVKEILKSEGIKTKQLQVSHAFHSPLMSPMLAEFEAVANQITYNQPRIPLISNVTGTTADDSITTASYWVNHIRQPVKFAQSMETLHQEGYEVFLEIGPKPILLGMGRQCLPEDVGIWLPSLRAGQSDWQQMLQSLGQLYVQGVKIDWSGFDRDYPRSKVVLPTYPFQQQRYWIKGTKNECYTNGDNTNEKQLDAIASYIHQFDTQQLVQMLEERGNFSPEQIELLPQLLQVLVEGYQHNVSTTSANEKSVNLLLETQSHNLSIRQQLEITPLKERHALLINYIEEHLSKVLGLDSSHKLQPTQALNAVGLDSLSAMELKNHFVKELEVDVAIEKIMEGMTIEQLADLLLMQFALTTINVSFSTSDNSAENMEEIIL
ncbi:MAG: polyketide synthase [Calothrix sp. MO_192.B10]|nr:polyketide synthase [Calothrix sp. MO_192.B10]